MVNVRKRGNGYQYYFEIAPVGGKRKQKVKSGFKTKTEAYNEGMKAYNEYNNTGHSFIPSQMSYSDYLDYWMKEHCEINLKYHTIEAYKNIIKNHVKPKLGFYRLSQITTSTLQEFINNVYVEKAFSKNFLKNILKVLKTSFTYATDVVGFVKENPALKVRLPKYDIPDKDPAHIFTKEELKRFFEACDDGFYYSLLYKAMFMTAYGGGLRLSELCNLKIKDIDSENMRILVQEGKGNKYRYTLLSQKNLEILRAYFKVYRPNHSEGYLFVSPMTHAKYGLSGPEIAFRRIRKKAGITRKVTVHGLRHNFATDLIENGLDILHLQKLLGHSGIRSTMEYLHLANVEKDIVNPLDRLYGSGDKNA